MKEYLRRNSVIFIVGLVLVALFVIALITAENNQNTKLPTLRRIQESEVPENPEPEAIIESPDNSENSVPKEPDPTSVYDALEVRDNQEMDEVFGILEIEFTEEGFNPIEVNGFTNQLVIWKNNTDRTIILTQQLNQFEDWENNDKIIEPGQTFSYRLKGGKNLWTYREVSSKMVGGIFIQPAVKSLRPR